MKSIAMVLNQTPRGKRFHNSNVADLLQRPHDLGRFPGSRFDESGRFLPEDDWIWGECPQLVSQEQFDCVAALRAARAPRNTPPRAVNGPTLLVGVAKCGMPSCGSGMTIRTGKSGQYKYCTCSAASNRGASSCNCPKIRAEKLDAARKRLSRIHDAIALGTMSPRDPDVRDRLKERRAEIDDLNATALTLQQQLQRGPTSITLAAVAKSGQIVRQRLIDGDSKARQRVVQAFVKTVRVGSTIKMEGETSALTRGAAGLARERDPVASFDRKWCGREDSNFHGLSPTTTSTLRVYQFRHDRTRVCRGRQASPAVGARP